MSMINVFTVNGTQIGVGEARGKDDAKEAAAKVAFNEMCRIYPEYAIF